MAKKVIYGILILCLCTVIFLFSSENGEVSGGKSRQLIKLSAISASVIAKNWGIIEKIPSHEEINDFVIKIEYPVRKLAHISIFFVLATVLMFSLRKITQLSFKKVCLICFGICFLMGFLDEFHQTFVNGRSGEILDVFIDSGGALLAILIYEFFRWLNNSCN